MKIQFFVRPESGSSFHRLLNPMTYDLSEGNEIEMLWHGTEESKINCDVLIYGQYLETDAMWIKHLKKNGTKIIVDVDDMWTIPSWLHGRDIFNKVKHTERVIENLKIADLVTCTTLRLQEEVRKYNKNTVVIPNALPYGYELYTPNNRQQDPDGKMRFIYVGGVSHIDDIQALEGKLKRIGSDGYLKQNSKFIVAGYRQHKAKRYWTWHDQKEQNENFSWVPVSGVWDKITSIVGNTGTCEVLPSLNPTEYLSHYDHGDISMIPLLDREWNYYKSTLKFAEAATRNIPVLCSKVAPYTDVEDVKGVIWVDGNDWYNRVKYCVKNPQYIQDMGLQLGEYCREHYDLLKWNIVRKQVIESLV